MKWFSTEPLLTPSCRLFSGGLTGQEAGRCYLKRKREVI